MRRHSHWLLLAALLVYDFSAFAFHAAKTDTAFESTLLHWDSNWYADLVGAGRDATPTPEARSRWAFLPLLLGVVRVLMRLTSLPSAFVGTALSVVALGVCVWLLSRRPVGSEAGPPVSAWGWFVFFFSPASLALHTFHTEALFLLASIVAWHAALDRRWWLSALAVAAAVWTRNQGVLLAVVIAVVWYRRHGLRLALVSVILSLVAYAGLLLYAAHFAGDALAFHHAQRHWDHVHSLSELLATFVMGNEPTPWRPSWVMRQLFAFGWLALIVVHLRRRDSNQALYSGLSFAPMLLQGQFHNIFRFSSVVFSTWFMFGDWVATSSRLIRLVVATGCLVLHHIVLLAWLKDTWAY